ncbi:MAG TPA: SdrD B-like domain-containing protein [Terriglobia bacterium]|nr:SdrD B-like domain-containing protein [Terriglobia bacterium]
MMRGLAQTFRTKTIAWPSGLAILFVILLAITGTAAKAQDSSSQLVEVYWQRSRTFPVAGVTGVTIVDDSICQAHVSTDKIELVGLARGETVAFIWTNDQRTTIRIRVVAPPEELPPPRLSQSALDALGTGMVGSSMQTFIDPQGKADFFFTHQFDWQQKIDDGRLSIHGQAQDSTSPGMPLFNANTLSIRYSTPMSDLKLMDFPLWLNGGPETKISTYSGFNVYEVRGADETLKRGDNQYEFFAGATIPSYYLTLTGTRDVAGFNFHRKQSEKLYLYTTTGWVNSPFQRPNLQSIRENSFYQTAGWVYRPDSEWAFQGSLGGSTRGEMAQGALSYSGEKLTAFVAGNSSAANFPLNQLQLFSGGGSSLSGGTTLKVSSRIASSLFLQHSSTESTAFSPFAGKSDFANPNLSFTITPHESVVLNYTYTRNSAGQALVGQSQGNRFDVALNSRMSRGISNTAEVTFGALSDPLQLNAAGKFEVRDDLSFRVRGGYLSVGVQHNRNSPSLVNNLKQEIGLLPSNLQQLFLVNPLAFTDSTQLDPQLRTLLENLRPADTEIYLSGQFRIKKRLSLSPNLSYIHNVAGLGNSNSSKLLGYSLNYQVTPSLQMISSLSSVYLLNSQQLREQRTTVFTIGFNKTLRGTPRWMAPFRPQKRNLSGRVFRDLNVNGVYNDGEPGLAGIRVDLNTGESVRTDTHGDFEFTGLAPAAYRVSVPMNQFTQAVRVTTPTDVRVDLIEQKEAEVDFGVVNFARLIGNVFNDYRLDGRMQPDANGIRGIELILSGGGVNRKIVSDGSGDYELYEVPPGDYRLSLDRSTLPPNYIASAEPVDIHVEPTATVVQDVPVEALRSISGHVYFKLVGGSILKTSAHGNNSAGTGGSKSAPGADDSNGNPILQPLPGVQISIGDARTTTDSQGGFVLRNLPAGDLMWTIIPSSPLPPGLAAPRGRVRMPRDPIQVENATIVISNPELLKYLVPSPSGVSSGK